MFVLLSSVGTALHTYIYSTDRRFDLQTEHCVSPESTLLTGIDIVIRNRHCKPESTGNARNLFFENNDLPRNLLEINLLLLLLSKLCREIAPETHDRKKCFLIEESELVYFDQCEITSNS